MILKCLRILILINISTEVLSAKILAVFPMPSISHQVVFRPLTQELARRGHEITIITTDPAFPNGGAPDNIKEIDVHDVSYQMWRKVFPDIYDVNTNTMTFTAVRQAMLLLAHILQIQLQSPQIQKLIADKNNKFDLILIEAVIRPALVFSHIFKAPVILVSSFGSVFNNDKIIGTPTHPLRYPSSLSKRIYNRTLYEKFSELYMHYYYEYAFYLNEEDEDKLLQQIFGPDCPPLNELSNNVDMLFLNIHPIWADNQPVPSSVIYMGGIHQAVEKELPKDLKKYLDSAKNGVIYLSFGTNVVAGMIPEDKVQIIVQVLSQLSYDVLWKWDKAELTGKQDNIKISKWYPQSDLLRHPKVRLFITQAGLQSTDEAISAGVPLVALPMLADQWYNAEKYVKYGIGKKLDIDSFTADDFKSAVETVIKDDSYRENIIRLRQLLRDQPEPPLQRAAWWAEYVIRHGGAKHLRSPAANMSYAQYFEIEVILVLLSTVLLVLVVTILFVIYIFRFFRNLSHDKEKIKLN